MIRFSFAAAVAGWWPPLSASFRLAGWIAIAAPCPVRAEAPPFRISVERTMMPEAGPSAFAVQIAPQLGFCYDPGRGGISYVWNGPRADLEPTWKSKINRAAGIAGRVVYRESIRFPLRPDPGTREPTWSFRGYAYLPEGVEFLYLVDGHAVRERIRPMESGRGLIREFRFEPGNGRWDFSVTANPGADIRSDDGSWNAANRSFSNLAHGSLSLRFVFDGAGP